jgi:hypothetical protein
MFKWTICDPLVEAVIDKGVIPKEGVLQAFSDFPWADMLAKMRIADSKGAHFSPSVEFTNIDDGCSLTASMIEDKKETVFSLFFEDATDDSDDAEFLGQSLDITVDILEEFVAGQYDRLRARVSCPSGPTPDSGGDSVAGPDNDFEFQCELEPFEAERMLPRLEEEKIRFQVETKDSDHWGARGYSKTSAIRLYIHGDDEERFRKVSDEFFKV